jgi:hypothetical protein
MIENKSCNHKTHHASWWQDPGRMVLRRHVDDVNGHAPKGQQSDGSEVHANSQARGAENMLNVRFAHTSAGSEKFHLNRIASSALWTNARSSWLLGRRAWLSQPRAS